MNSYQLKYSAEKIEGYMSNDFCIESVEGAFEKAKMETIKNYEIYLQNLKDLTLTQFLSRYPRYKRIMIDMEERKTTR